MDQGRLLDRLWCVLKSWASALMDALPPYHRVEGRLKTKECRPPDKFYIHVGPEMIEVDGVTFERLLVGENLRVRYTRARRAINIDRLVPPERLSE